MHGLSFVSSLSVPHPTDHWYLISYTCHNKPCEKEARLCIQHIPKIMDSVYHNDVIKWKHFPRYWPFMRGIHRSPVNSPHKGQWRGSLIFSLIWAWKNGWVYNLEAGDLRRHRAYYDVTVMFFVVVFEVLYWYIFPYPSQLPTNL